MSVPHAETQTVITQEFQDNSPVLDNNPRPASQFEDQEGFLSVGDMVAGTSEIIGHNINTARLSINGLRQTIAQMRERRNHNRIAEIDDRQERREHIEQAGYAGVSVVPGYEHETRRERNAALRASRRANRVVASRMSQLRTATYGTTDPAGHRLKDVVHNPDGTVKTKEKNYEWIDDQGGQHTIIRHSIELTPRPSDVGTDAQLLRINSRGYSREWRRQEKKARSKHLKEDARQKEVFARQDAIGDRIDKEGLSYTRSRRKKVNTVARMQRKQTRLSQQHQRLQQSRLDRLDRRNVRLEPIRQERDNRRRARRERIIRETMSGF